MIIYILQIFILILQIFHINIKVGNDPLHFKLYQHNIMERLFFFIDMDTTVDILFTYETYDAFRCHARDFNFTSGRSSY